MERKFTFRSILYDLLGLILCIIAFIEGTLSILWLGIAFFIFSYLEEIINYLLEIKNELIKK